MNITVKNNERPDICKKCGGTCCQRIACEISSGDFMARYGEITKDTIMSALKNGEWAINWTCCDVRDIAPGACANLPKVDAGNRVSRSYYMRVRQVNEPAAHAQQYGVCKMWNRETGCAYDWNHRPAGGRVMPVGSCKLCGEFYDPDVKYEQYYGGLTACVDWFPYFDILDEISHMTEFCQTLT